MNQNNKIQSNFNNRLMRVIVVILLVALIGSIAIIVCQCTTKTSTKIASNEKVLANYPTTAKTLAIKEWGVVGYYMGNQTLRYEVKDNVLHFTSDAIKATCGYDYSGFITRYTASQHISTKGYGVVDASAAGTSSAADTALVKSHIGNYYYILTDPQASCVSATNSNVTTNVTIANGSTIIMPISSAQGEVFTEINDFFLTLNN